MSEDFLKNPLSLFDVRGKAAIVTGASGAFGALAAKVLAGAGANVVLSASNAAELKKVADACNELGGKTEIVAKRPSLRSQLRRHRGRRPSDRFGRVDILVVASGLNKVSKIVDQPAADFLEIIDANVTQSWLMARAAGRQMIKQGGGGKVILMSSARGLLGHTAGYTAYCASKWADQRHHQGAGLRVGRKRDHRQCARTHGIPFAADAVDVRGHRARQHRAQGLPHPRAQRASRRAVRPTPAPFHPAPAPAPRSTAPRPVRQTPARPTLRRIRTLKRWPRRRRPSQNTTSKGRTANLRRSIHPTARRRIAPSRAASTPKTARTLRPTTSSNSARTRLRNPIAPFVIKPSVLRNRPQRRPAWRRAKARRRRPTRVAAPPKSPVIAVAPTATMPTYTPAVTRPARIRRPPAPPTAPIRRATPIPASRSPTSRRSRPTPNLMPRPTNPRIPAAAPASTRRRTTRAATTRKPTT